jgi:hypothetical protein
MSKNVAVPFDIVTRYLVPIVAVAIVAGSVLYTGVIESAGARDIDTRYFYAAAKCWGAGHSPYEPETYIATYRNLFGSPPAALFVAYLPSLLLIVLPMAPFQWAVAAKLFMVMNYAAAMVLFWACYRLVVESVGAPLKVRHWVWVVLASTIGGISGTISTGQTSVFIAAAMAAALVGCRLQWTWLTVASLVVATAKPHLSGPLILFILLFEPRHRKAAAIAALILAVTVAYAAVTDAHLFHSYLDSMRTYNLLPANDPMKQIGLVSMLLRLGMGKVAAQALGVVGLVASMGMAARLLWRSGKSLSQCPVAMMLLILSVGLARGLQGYDVCCYATGIALLATLRPWQSVALLSPSLLIWRPAVARAIHLHLPVYSLETGAWLVLLVGVAAISLSLANNRFAGSAERTGKEAAV